MDTDMDEYLEEFVKPMQDELGLSRCDIDQYRVQSQETFRINRDSGRSLFVGLASDNELLQRGLLKIKVCPAAFTTSLDQIHLKQWCDLCFTQELSTPVASEYRDTDLPTVACRKFKRVDTSEIEVPLRPASFQSHAAGVVTNVVIPTRRLVQLDKTWSDYPIDGLVYLFIVVDHRGCGGILDPKYIPTVEQMLSDGGETRYDDDIAFLPHADGQIIATINAGGKSMEVMLYATTMMRFQHKTESEQDTDSETGTYEDVFQPPEHEKLEEIMAQQKQSQDQLEKMRSIIQDKETNVQELASKLEAKVNEYQEALEAKVSEHQEALEAKDNEHQEALEAKDSEHKEGLEVKVNELREALMNIEALQNELNEGGVAIEIKKEELQRAQEYSRVPERTPYISPWLRTLIGTGMIEAAKYAYLSRVTREAARYT
jgi:hypothetical protein